MIVINQLLPDIAYGDAISNHVIELKKLFRKMGFQSEIYVLNKEKSVSQHARPVSEFKSSDEGITLYHYSIGNDKTNQIFKSARGKKVLVYHNITPHQFFVGYHDELAALLKKGREALGEFRDIVDLAIGDSEYNAQELREAGYKNPRVHPILLDFSGFQKTAADPEFQRYVGDSWTTFFFAGRVVPNKAHHDLIKAFAWYNRNIDPLSRLIMVGGTPLGKYLIELNRLIFSLGLSERIFIPGRISFSKLVGYYQAADVFLCMSEHEGFCVPLIEAMYFDVPIIAYDSTGVTHTLGQSGILVKKKDPQMISEVADLLVKDSAFRNQVISRQRERFQDFQPDVLKKQYEELFQELVK